MITPSIHKYIYNSMGRKNIEEVMAASKDYVEIALDITNNSSMVTLTAHDYDSVLEESIIAEGNLFVDKDDFIRLYKESDSDNPYFIEYV